jgi:hypothetical protein
VTQSSTHSSTPELVGGARYEPIVHLGTGAIDGWTARPVTVRSEDLEEEHDTRRRFTYAVGALHALRSEQRLGHRRIVLNVSRDRFADPHFTTWLVDLGRTSSVGLHGLVVEIDEETIFGGPTPTSMQELLAHDIGVALRLNRSLLVWDVPLSLHSLEFVRLQRPRHLSPFDVASCRAALLAWRSAGIATLVDRLDDVADVEDLRRMGCAYGSGPALAAGSSTPVTTIAPPSPNPSAGHDPA